MAGDSEAPLGGAQAALTAGEWSAARDRFKAALEQVEAPAALFGLGVARWWLRETEAALRLWERAYAVARKHPDPEHAFLASFYLCLAYGMSIGNEAASRGWLGRLASVVDEFELAPMQGWVLLCRAYFATDSGHPQQAEVFAQEARRLAREFEDADLALCAMSEHGAALVQLGSLDEGTALLDEAMAGALAGEAGDLDTVVLIGCRTITSCSRAADLKRAVQWVRAADDFNKRYGSTHLYTTCRTHYGGLLYATGRWSEAEEELKAALEIGKAAEPALHAEALAKLAELRLAQGRLDEATRLLAGYEDHPPAAYAVAAIHLARGEPVVASSLLRRCLRQLDEECLEAAALLELVADAEIAQGAVQQAMTHAEKLAELGERLGCDLIVARGERALGCGLAAIEDQEGAIPHLEYALAAFGRLEMPLDANRSRLLLARALAESEREAAISEARAALAGFEELGAATDADKAAAFLRSLGVKAARAGPKGIGVLTKRELEVLGLLGEGLSNPDIAERLFLSRKTVEHHVASVLSKLGLSGRGEAAAYAVRHLERDPATK
jgi:ATP/maltotriose-dependent transcriptional regulator MalT